MQAKVDKKIVGDSVTPGIRSKDSVLYYSADAQTLIDPCIFGGSRILHRLASSKELVHYIIINKNKTYSVPNMNIFFTPSPYPYICLLVCTAFCTSSCLTLSLNFLISAFGFSTSASYSSTTPLSLLISASA